MSRRMKSDVALRIASIGLALAALFGWVGVNATPAAGATDLCSIVSPSDGTIAPDGKSVAYTVPAILGSSASSAPFVFTVQNVAAATITLSIAESPALTAPFSVIALAPGAAFSLAAGAARTIHTGIAWTELSNANAGTSRTVTWTVSCFFEAPAPPVAPTPSGSVLGATSPPRTASPPPPTLAPTSSVAGVTSPPRPNVTVPPTDTLQPSQRNEKGPASIFLLLVLLAGVSAAVAVLLRGTRSKE